MAETQLAGVLLPERCDRMEFLQLSQSIAWEQDLSPSLAVLAVLSTVI
jgi:hypothetical protein